MLRHKSLFNNVLVYKLPHPDLFNPRTYAFLRIPCIFLFLLKFTHTYYIDRMIERIYWSQRVNVPIPRSVLMWYSYVDRTMKRWQRAVSDHVSHRGSLNDILTRRSRCSYDRIAAASPLMSVPRWYYISCSRQVTQAGAMGWRLHGWPLIPGYIQGSGFAAKSSHLDVSPTEVKSTCILQFLDI